MIFELQHAPFPPGYTESLLPLELCKQHLSIEPAIEDDDALVEAFRDAAIEFVEGYCGLYLGPREDAVWQAESFPALASAPLMLGVGRVSEITAISWRDATGAEVSGDPADFRLTPGGGLLPAYGGNWPGDVGGGIAISFSAGFPDGEAPPALLQAARLMLADMFLNREAALDQSVTLPVPRGVRMLCSPFRRVIV